MADINSVPGSESWLAAVAKIENAAPLDVSGPMPKTVNTLAYIPAERQVCYARAMDGSFRLRFIHSTDEASRTAYQDDIAAGKLRTFDPGDSPELRAKKAQEAEARNKAILDKVNADEATARKAKADAAYNASLREVKDRYGR